MAMLNTPKKTGTRSDFDASGKKTRRSVNATRHEAKKSGGEKYPKHGK